MRARNIVLILQCVASFGLMSLACVSRSNQPPVRTEAAPSPSPSTTSTHLDNNKKTPEGHYEIKPSSLPPPYATPDTENPPRLVQRPAGAELQLPPGFAAATFAEGGFQRPRWLASASNGDIFVADSDAGSIVILRDTNNDGTADERFIFTLGLNRPFGMAFWRNYLYVGNTDAVVRFSHQPGQIKAEAKPEVITDLPSQGYREHWTRNLQFDPAGTRLYVTIGSQSDVDIEPEPRGSILELKPDGSGRRIFASGLRNPIGLSFHPVTNALWAAVQERDHLGDDLPPDYVTRIKEGGFYGWPYSYIGSNPDPRRRGERPDLVRQAIAPDVLIQAHSAVLGLIFYKGTMFPQSYRGDAFVALHGSWNRSKRTGYKIVRIPFKNNRPAGGYYDFITGWMLNEDAWQVWGRPSGLLVLKDGSMLIADDGANKIWRITYLDTAAQRPAKSK